MRDDRPTELAEAVHAKTDRLCRVGGRDRRLGLVTSHTWVCSEVSTADRTAGSGGLDQPLPPEYTAHKCVRPAVGAPGRTAEILKSRGNRPEGESLVDVPAVNQLDHGAL